MICDGGDHAEGCNKSFHIQCIGLESVPSGDWICSSCATEEGITTQGNQGHEYLEAVESANDSDGDCGQESSDCEFDEHGDVASSAVENRQSKRRVILESDEEMED